MFLVFVFLVRGLEQEEHELFPYRFLISQKPTANLLERTFWLRLLAHHAESWPQKVNLLHTVRLSPPTLHPPLPVPGGGVGGGWGGGGIRGLSSVLF